jgi:outer membrane protein TolC
VLFVLASSVPARAETLVRLSELRAQALKDRPELAAEDARVAQAAARVDEAGAARRPEIAGTVETSVAPGGQLVELPASVTGDGPLLVQGSPTLDQGGAAFEPQVRYAGVVGVDWNVHDFGRTEAAERAARAEARAREADRALTRRRLLSAVDATYLEWLAAERRAHAEAETVVRRRAALEDAKGRVEAGALPPSALLPLKSELAAAELSAAYAKDAELRALRAVGRAAGAPLPEDARPDPSLLELGANPLEAQPREAPEAAALQARVEAAEATAELHDRAGRPQLTASAQVGVRGQLEDFFPVYRGAIGLRLPLWDGGEAAAKAARARAEKRALMAERARQIEARAEETRAARLALRQARRRVELAAAFLSSAEAQLADAEDRRASDAATDAEVTRARAQAARAAGQLLTAKVDRAAAALRLAR